MSDPRIKDFVSLQVKKANPKPKLTVLEEIYHNKINKMTEQYRENLKAQKALAKAKSIPIKTIFIPRVVTGIALSDQYQLINGRNGKRGLDHSEVLKMLKDGSTIAEIALKFKITKQMVSYIKNKKSSV